MNSESFPGTQHHRQEGDGETEGWGGDRQTQTWGPPVPVFWGSLAVVVPKAGACMERREQLLRKEEPCVCVCVCRQEIVWPITRAAATLPDASCCKFLFFVNLMCFAFVFTVHNLTWGLFQLHSSPVCHLFTVAHLDYCS